MLQDINTNFLELILQLEASLYEWNPVAIEYSWNASIDSIFQASRIGICCILSCLRGYSVMVSLMEHKLWETCFKYPIYSSTLKKLVLACIDSWPWYFSYNSFKNKAIMDNDWWATWIHLACSTEAVCCTPCDSLKYMRYSSHVLWSAEYLISLLFTIPERQHKLETFWAYGKLLDQVDELFLLNGS